MKKPATVSADKMFDPLGLLKLEESILRLSQEFKNNGPVFAQKLEFYSRILQLDLNLYSVFKKPSFNFRARTRKSNC